MIANIIAIGRRNPGGGVPRPSEQAHDIVFSNPTSGSVTVSWTNVESDFVLVLAKIGTAVDSLPVDGVTYSDDSTFGDGDELGTGNFVVYKGTADNFSMTHDGETAKYGFRVIAGNGEPGSEKYNTSTAVLNPESIATELLLSGLMQRLAFDELLAAVADGATVPTMVEPISGASWVPGATTPTAQTDAEGGFKFMRIVTSSKIGSTTKMDYLHTGANTVIFVIKRSNNVDATVLFDTRNNTSANVGRTIAGYNNGEIRDRARSSAGEIFDNYHSTSPIYPISMEWDAVVFNYKNNGGADDSEILLNGAVISIDGTTVAPAAGTSSHNSSIGRSSLNTGLSFECDIALALFFSRELTVTQIDQVLGSRDGYGLEV